MPILSSPTLVAVPDTNQYKDLHPLQKYSLPYITNLEQKIIHWDTNLVNHIKPSTSI